MCLFNLLINVLFLALICFKKKLPAYSISNHEVAGMMLHVSLTVGMFPNSFCIVSIKMYQTYSIMKGALVFAASILSCNEDWLNIGLITNCNDIDSIPTTACTKTQQHRSLLKLLYSVHSLS